MATASRILLVEDEPSVRELLQLVLVRQGHDIDVAVTGTAALAMCDRVAPPDLLITDLVLPDVPGPVIAERLRSRVPHARVLFMSGDVEHPWLQAARAAGEPCLAKPFSVATFTSTVDKVLAARTA